VLKCKGGTTFLTCLSFVANRLSPVQPRGLEKGGEGGEGKGANRVSVHGGIVERSPTIDV